VGLRDIIKKLSKRWDGFLQRHKSFRFIWWFIEGSVILFLLITFLGLLIMSWPLVFFIFYLIVDPVNAINELSGGKLGDMLLNVLFMFMIIIIVRMLWVSWRRGAGFRRWKKLDEEKGVEEE